MGFTAHAKGQIPSSTSIAAEIANHWDEEPQPKPKRPDPVALAVQQLNGAMLALKAIADNNESRANETAAIDLSLAMAESILAEKIEMMLFESDHPMSRKLGDFIEIIVQDRLRDAIANLGNSINTNAVSIARR